MVVSLGIIDSTNNESMGSNITVPLSRKGIVLCIVIKGQQ